MNNMYKITLSGLLAGILLASCGGGGSSSRSPSQMAITDQLSLADPDDIAATVGASVSETLPAATGGSTPYTYTVTGLPTGLRFTASTHVVSGTPTSASTATATYRVTDSASAEATQTFTVTVGATAPPLSLADPSDITATEGVFISETLPAATDGSPPYRYTVTGLPTGLRFSASSRVVSGTVTRAQTATVTYRVTDSAGTVRTQIFTVTVGATVPPLSLADPSDMTDTVRGRIVEALPAATGGSPPYRYTVTGLPTGLRFTESTRAVVGTPTSAGIATAIYRVTDSAGTVRTRTFTVTVTAELVLAVPYSISVSARESIREILPAATGGSPPYRYTVTGLPAGLRFTESTRVVSGTPTEAGRSTATYTVTDSAGDFREDILYVTVYFILVPNLPPPGGETNRRHSSLAICNDSVVFSEAGNVALPSIDRVRIPSESGTLRLQYNAKARPDRFVVAVNNSALIDTGYVGSRDYSISDINDVLRAANLPLTSQGSVREPRSGTANGRKTSSAREAVVYVYAPLRGSEWTVTLTWICNTPVGGTPAIQFTLTDECSERGKVRAKFFTYDKSSPSSSDLVGIWPSRTRSYITGTSPPRTGGTIGPHTFSCSGNIKSICYGAEHENRETYYWGVGLDGDKFCTSCCYTCPSSGTRMVSKNLTCRN